MIVAAAVRYTIPEFPGGFPYRDPIVFTMPRPARHGNIVATLSLLHPAAALEAEQGFITDDGVFLNRRDAFIHAVANAQPWRSDRGHRPGATHLFSEDIW